MSVKKKQKNRNYNAGKKAGPKEDIAEYIAILPGVLMCAMLVIMLMLDVVMPGMDVRQYEVFPNMFTFMDHVICAGGLLCIGIAVKRRELHFRKTDPLFAAFALLIIVSTFANGFNMMTIDGVPYRFIGILNMFAFMLIYMGVTGSIKSGTFRRYILLGYLFTADLIGAAALYDKLTGGIAAFHEKKEISAIFFNGNHYGYFLLMAILVGLGYYLFDSERGCAAGSDHIKAGRADPAAVFGAFSAALNMVLLAVNHSLGSILALIAVLICTAIIIFIRDHKYIKKMAALAAVLIVVFAAAVIVSPALRKEFTVLAGDIGAILSSTAEGSVGHRRLQMWTLTAGYISEKPLLGYGCEGIAFMLYEAMKVSDPHCETLAYAAYYGIPAALLYVAGVTGVIITSLRRTDSNSVQEKAACMAAAGYFISSFVGVGMFYTLPFFFIMLGLSLGDSPR